MLKFFKRRKSSIKLILKKDEIISFCLSQRLDKEGATFEIRLTPSKFNMKQIEKFIIKDLKK